jgi:hypothetical protein
MERSQVQTLSRPPAFSQVTALPVPCWERSLPAWAALGPRAHPHRPARWPCRAHPPGRPAPQRPPSVVATQPKTATTRCVQEPGAAACSRALDAAASSGRPSRRSGLPGGQWSSAVAARAEHHPARARPTSQPMPDPGSVARVQADSSRRPNRSGTGRPFGSRPVAAVKVPAAPTWSPKPPPG